MGFVPFCLGQPRVMVLDPVFQRGTLRLGLRLGPPGFTPSFWPAFLIQWGDGASSLSLLGVACRETPLPESVPFPDSLEHQSLRDFQGTLSVVGQHGGGGG